MERQGAIEEFDLIARVFRPLAAGSSASLNLVDDAAVLDPGPGFEVIVTTDTLSESVHFRSEDSPDVVAQRALASNMSDLAAMAAEPLGYTLAIAAPASTPASWFEEFAAGLAAEQARYGTGLLGGDTTKSPGGLMITITALGRAPKGLAIKRSNAKADDHLWVSGTIGDATLGLAILQGDISAQSRADREFLVERFNRPTARLVVASLLRSHATSAIDVSDGLIADVGHIATASNLAVEIEGEAIPLSTAARSVAESPGDGGTGMLARLMSGGDDYEIAFTAPASAQSAIERWSADNVLPLSRIGRLTSPSSERIAGSVSVIDVSGEALIMDGPGGYRHFQS